MRPDSINRVPWIFNQVERMMGLLDSRNLVIERDNQAMVDLLKQWGAR